MKAGFFYDAKLSMRNNSMCSSMFTDAFWDRYLRYYNEILVVSRCIDVKDTKAPIAERKDVEYSCIKCTGNLAKDYLQLMFSSKVRKHVKKCVKQVDFAIIRLPSEIGLIALKECKKQNKPYIVELVGCPWDSNWNHGKLGKLLAPYMTIRTKLAIKNAKNVIYVSQQYLQKKYPNKYNNVGCPDVMLDMPQSEILEKRIDRINNSNDKTFVLGLIGGLNVQYRGHKRAISVLKNLVDLGYNVEIRFLGGGDKTELEKYSDNLGLKNKVYFDGTLSSGEPVLNWLDNVDCLIMPTQAETLGRAIIEAMSRGCAVVGSLETAIPEQIGFDCIASYNDVNGFTRIVERLILDKDYYLYTAQENFYRSQKYCNEQTNLTRDLFYIKILQGIKND